MATLSLCICSQKYHFLAFTCTRLLTHSKLLHMLAIRFAKTLASIYIGTVIHQITLPQSKKHYLLFFCVKMVKTEGETILQVKKSWKFFMELPGTPKTGLLCRGNYIKKKKSFFFSFLFTHTVAFWATIFFLPQISLDLLSFNCNKITAFCCMGWWCSNCQG